MLKKKYTNFWGCSDLPDPFFIERGLRSRTEIGEREINAMGILYITEVQLETGHYLAVCTPPPPPLHNLIRGAIWSPTSLSPPSHPYPFWTV
jgi:hypothetical protein